MLILTDDYCESTDDVLINFFDICYNFLKFFMDKTFMNNMDLVWIFIVIVPLVFLSVYAAFKK